MSLDKFYTKTGVAERLVTITKNLLEDEVDYVIEPSAGDGSFIGAINTTFPLAEGVFIDILPEHSDVTQCDWFKWNVGEVFENSLIIGNPPFGKNASLAVRFFNKAALHKPRLIAFILPRTFQKKRFCAKHLDNAYSLLVEEVCEKNSFVVNGESYNVPCVMQVWGRRTRKDTFHINPILFEEVAEDEATLFIRRAGGRAGEIVEKYTQSSTYAVKCSDETRKLLESRKQQIKEQSCKTVGVRSITLLEIEDILLGIENGI